MEGIMEADKSLNKIDPAGVNSGQEPEKEQTTERQETQEQAEQKDIQQEQEKQSPHSEEDQAKIADMTKRHMEWEKLIQSQREGYGNGAMLPSVGKVMRVFPKGQSVGAMLGMVKQIADDGKSVIMQLVNGSYYRFDLTDLQITKSAVIQLLIQKAKRRNVGEVWTQASGRRVTKKAQGKIVEVKGRKQELEQSKKGRVHAAVKNQQSLNFAKKETVNQEKEVKPVNRGSEIDSHKVIGSTTEKTSAKVTTGINTHVGEVHHELNTSHLNPRQAADAKEIHEKLKNLPESGLRTRLERLKKLPNNGGAAGITAINHILNRPQVSSEAKTEVQEKVTGVNKIDDAPKEQPRSEEHAKEIKSAKVKEAVKAKKGCSKKINDIINNTLSEWQGAADYQKKIYLDKLKEMIDSDSYEGDMKKAANAVYDRIKDFKPDPIQLSQEDMSFISDRLYALNKKAKEYRDAGINSKKKDLYDIKNKIIQKLGTPTGKMHQFEAGFGNEYSISVGSSFHDYHRYVDEFLKEKEESAMENQNVKEIVNNIKNNEFELYFHHEPNYWDYAENSYGFNLQDRAYTGKRDEIINEFSKKLQDLNNRYGLGFEVKEDQFSLRFDYDAEKFRDLERQYAKKEYKKNKTKKDLDEMKSLKKQIERIRSIYYKAESYKKEYEDKISDELSARENLKDKLSKELFESLKNNTGYMTASEALELPNIGTMSSELKENTKPISDDEIEYLRKIANSGDIIKSFSLYKSGLIGFIVNKTKSKLLVKKAVV